MNKFKKILGVALIAIMIMMPVFGAYSNEEATLTITAVVASKIQMGLFDVNKPTTNDNFDVGNATMSKTIDLSTESGKTLVIVLAVRSNHKAGFSVAVNAKPLAIGSTERVMEYDLLFGTAETGTNITVSGTNNLDIKTEIATHTLSVAADLTTGMTIYGFPFTVEISDTQYNKAMAGSYEGSIVFNLTAN